MFKNLKFIARRNYSLFLNGESVTGKSLAPKAMLSLKGGEGEDPLKPGIPGGLPILPPPVHY